jgi:hypothetical protein
MTNRPATWALCEVCWRRHADVACEDCGKRLCDVHAVIGHEEPGDGGQWLCPVCVAKRVGEVALRLLMTKPRKEHDDVDDRRG